MKENIQLQVPDSDIAQQLVAYMQKLSFLQILVKKKISIASTQTSKSALKQFENLEKEALQEQKQSKEKFDLEIINLVNFYEDSSDEEVKDTFGR